MYEGREDSTKTLKSNRKLPVPAELVARMRHLGRSGLVFQTAKGTPVNPGNALKRYLRAVLRELDIPLGGWRDFRHTATTEMIEKGFSPKVVSEILGHSDVGLTLNVYDHPNIESFRQPLNEAAKQFLPSVAKTVPAAWKSIDSKRAGADDRT